MQPKAVFLEKATDEPLWQGAKPVLLAILTITSDGSVLSPSHCGRTLKTHTHNIIVSTLLAIYIYRHRWHPCRTVLAGALHPVQLVFVHRMIVLYNQSTKFLPVPAGSYIFISDGSRK